ncbi:rhodanese-related sulfurtransferase [Subtercola sp. PAMC28395]|uniref:tRNA uridine(34) hydroxylase n=1 Tax=Subtercola sp. PAMC28395 TaxID=2846775 RepID=UPI001C0C8FCD|nr:rhodanese-related sulfurtransferase [Subtercola sp. PAMC28395]QWT24711.1 rhodanese-related sulfurtransferase [Subtercola sp. PAMC28395]
MAVSKIILYYAFVPLADPEAIRLWQRDLCESLGLRGRILISEQGINGTLGGELSAMKLYVRKTREYKGFAELDVKWSDGSGLSADPTADTEAGRARLPSSAVAPHGYSVDFPRLSVKVRDEIVSFGAPGELLVDDRGVVGGGTKLSPLELHTLVESQKAAGDEVVFFDGRNSFEAEIGRFDGAIVPDVSNTREFVAELDSGKYDHLKSKPVVTYCTGGIRCEVLSSLMASRGFEHVYQLDGGIVRYGESFGDTGLWQGSLYVFDNRLSVNFSPDARPIGACYRCGSPTSSMQNCADLACRAQLVICDDCSSTGHAACELHTASLANPPLA